MIPPKLKIVIIYFSSKNFIQWSNAIEIRGLDDQDTCFIKIPAYPCYYTFLSTEALSQTSYNSLPLFVDLIKSIYIYPTESRTVCGGFIEGDLQALSFSHKNGAVDCPIPNWDKFCLFRFAHNVNLVV